MNTIYITKPIVYLPNQIEQILENNPIFNNKNAGGNSKTSEAMSLEIIKTIYNDIIIDKLETEINYIYDFCSKRIDYICKNYYYYFLVSVMRATEYNYNANNGYHLMEENDLEMKLINKIEGFGNVQLETENKINILFVWCDIKFCDFVINIVKKIIQNFIDKNIYIIISPTSSVQIMYETDKFRNIEEYNKNIINCIIIKRANIEKMRLERRYNRQKQQWINICRAIKLASKNIIKQNSRKKIKNELNNRNYYILYKWHFSTKPYEGVFRNFFISNLINSIKYTSSMNIFEPPHFTLINSLDKYYNKKNNIFEIFYVKDFDINMIPTGLIIIKKINN